MSEQQSKRGGARPGAGRKPKPAVLPVGDKDHAAQILAKIWGPRPHPVPSDPKDDCHCEFCWWWDRAHSGRKEDNAMIWRLYEKVYGKAVHTVNHLHDKPLDVNVHHSISERFRIALEKGDKRVHELRGR